MARKSGQHHEDRVASVMVMGLESARAHAIFHSTSLVNRACMVVTDAEPDRLASLAPPAPLGLRGVWVVRRAVAPTPWRGVLTCPRASVRGRSRRAPPPKSGPRLPLARALLTTGRERIPSRRGCWGCCAGRPGPRSPPSWNPPAGSRTRCGGSLPAWCARSSGSSLPPRRPTAAGPTDRWRWQARRHRA